MNKNPHLTPLLVACLFLSVSLANVQQLAGQQSSFLGTEPDEGIRFQPPVEVVLRNATICIGGPEDLVHGNLHIKHGKIVALGANATVPPAAKTIDCSGLYLYPAFVDGFVELDANRLAASTGYWNSQVRPEIEIAENLESNGEQLKTLRQAGVAIALAVPKDGIIKGQSCVATVADAPLAERMLRARAFQHIKLFPSRGSRRQYPNSPMGAVALVRQALLDAQWYGQAQRAVQADPALPLPEANSALASLGDLLAGNQQVVFDGNNELYALRADRIGREFSLRTIIRGSGREYRCIDAIAATNRTYIIPVDFPKAPEVSTAANAADATLQSLMHWRLAPENPGRLEKAGVHFVLTADGLSKPGDLLTNVRKAIEHGLTPERALAALTSEPAKLLGIENIAGSLEVGKLANLLVTNGPLFESETVLQQTWVQGIPYEFKPNDVPDLSGDWHLASTSGSPPMMYLTITGEATKPKANISNSLPTEKDATDKSTDSPQPEEDEEDIPSPEPEGDQSSAPKPKRQTSKINNLGISNFRLSGTFTSHNLGQADGTATLEATILPSAQGLMLQGTVLWPDASITEFTATRQADKKTEDSSDSSDTEEQSEASVQRVACEVNFPLGAYGMTSAPQQHDWVLVKNATIWTCGEAGVLSNADMLIHRGRIEQVGLDIAVPEGALVIDGTDLHVSPGIIDCHSHMATDGGVNESAQAVTAEVRIGDFIDATDITIYRQLAGGVTAANILHGSANPIGGQNQVIKLRWGSLPEQLKMVEAPSGIKFALGENVKQSNLGDDYTTRYPQTRMGVEQIMRDRFEAAIQYKQRAANWAKYSSGLPPRRDLELEALAEVLDGSRWIHCHSYRQDEILTFLRVLEDYHVTVGTLQHILEGYKVADAMARHGAMGSSFSDWWAYKLEVADAIPFNGALMHRAGVVVSFNSDDAELARHLNHEAAKAVKYGGLSPEEALKFVTLNPAKQLRIDEYVGSLETGKQADFVIWNRSPLSTYSVCLETWIDGRQYFSREKDMLRRQQDAELHRALVQSILNADDQGRKGEAGREDPSTWWARYDEFCNHGHHDEHDHSALEHADEAQD